MKKELYHSDTYLGQEFSDGLKHYKYLKKVRTSSGKWRYIYDETELKKAESEINNLKKVRDKLKNKDGYLKYVDKNGNTVYKKDGSTLTMRGNNKQTAADKVKESINDKIASLEKKHAKQKIKDIPKRIVSRGIGFVSNFLDNLKKKWVK